MPHDTRVPTPEYPRVPVRVEDANSRKCVSEAYHWRIAIVKRRVYCSSATVFRTSLALILAKVLRKLATSEKALVKRMPAACLPPYFGKRIIRLWARGRVYNLHCGDFGI